MLDALKKALGRSQELGILVPVLLHYRVVT
jgi:hypothetical protein